MLIFSGDASILLAHHHHGLPPLLKMLNDVAPPNNFVVVVPGLILSQHQQLKTALRAKAKAISEGFTDAVIMQRNGDGWKECPASGESG